MGRLIPFEVLLTLVVLALIVVALTTRGLDVWEYIHDKLRRERKEDEEDERRHR